MLIKESTHWALALMAEQAIASGSIGDSSEVGDEMGDDIGDEGGLLSSSKADMKCLSTTNHSFDLLLSSARPFMIFSMSSPETASDCASNASNELA